MRSLQGSQIFVGGVVVIKCILGVTSGVLDQHSWRETGAGHVQKFYIRYMRALELFDTNILYGVLPDTILLINYTGSVQSHIIIEGYQVPSNYCMVAK